MYSFLKHYQFDLDPPDQGKSNINAICPRPVHVFKYIDSFGKLIFRFFNQGKYQHGWYNSKYRK